MFLTPLEVTSGVGILAAAVAATLGGLNLRQKSRNDDRDAWWKRAQWAIDHSLSVDPATREIGSKAMLVLAEEPGVSESDLAVLDAALVRAIDAAPPEAQDT